MKVVIVILAAVIMSGLGMKMFGAFGAVMGFVCTILIIWFFSFWKNLKN